MAAGLLWGGLLVGVAATAPRDDADPARHNSRTIVLPLGDAPSRADATAAVALTSDERELVRWAVGRFDQIGFELPDVRVSFHEDSAPCGGHAGRYVMSDGLALISICVPDLDTFAFDLLRRRTLVHELAHAWDAANLDDAARAELLPVVDSAAWSAPESDWHRRGSERFAETIVWGLYDQLRRPVDIDVPCAELHADFVRITGSHALGPIEPVCRPTT